MSNNDLQHHGILGMKWGVRRTPEQLGRKTSGETPGVSRKARKAEQREALRSTLTTEQKDTLARISAQKGKRATNRVLKIYGSRVNKKGGFQSAVVQREVESFIGKALYTVGVLSLASLALRK